MSESMEQALEHAMAGILFCAAFMMLVWLHTTFLQQVQSVGKSSERLILTEQNEGR